MLVRWEFWPRVAASTPLPPSRCLVSCCLHQPKRSFQRCGTVCMAQPVPDTSQGQTSTGHLSQSRQMQRCSSPPHTHKMCPTHKLCSSCSRHWTPNHTLFINVGHPMAKMLCVSTPCRHTPSVHHPLLVSKLLLVSLLRHAAPRPQP